MERSDYSVQNKIHNFCVQLFIERCPDPLFGFLHPDIYFYCNKIDAAIQGKTEVCKYLPELCQSIKLYGQTELSHFRLTNIHAEFYNVNVTVSYDGEAGINASLLFENANEDIIIKEIHLYWNILVKEEEKPFCIMPKQTNPLIGSSLYCGNFSIMVTDSLSLQSCDQKLLSMLQYESFSELKQNTPYFYQLLHPQYKEETLSEITALKQYGKDCYSKLCLVGKNGCPLWILAVAQKFTVNNFELINFSCFDFRSQKNNYLHDQNLLNCINGGYGIFIVNNRQKIFPLFFNETLYKLLEKNPADYPFPSPRLISSAIIPEDRTCYIKAMQNIARGKAKDIQITLRTITKSGQIKWFRTSSVKVLSDENADFYYVYVIFTDITDVKQKHQVLLQSFKKAQTAHLLCSDDENWSVSYANEQAYSILNLTQTQLECDFHNNFAELFPPAQKEAYLSNARSQLAQNGFFFFTADLACCQKTATLQLAGEKILSEDNLFTLSLYRPDSDQNKYYNLLELKNELTSLYQNIPAIIFHCSKNARLIFANDCFYKLANCSKDQFASLHNNDLRSVCTKTSFRSAQKILIKNIRTKNTKCFFEITLITKDHSLETLLINATVLYDEQGKFSKLYCIASEQPLSKTARLQYFDDKTTLEAICRQLGSAFWKYNIQTEECDLHIRYNGDLIHFHYGNFVKEILEGNILAEESKAQFIAIHDNLKKGIACQNAVIGFYEAKNRQTWYGITYIIPKNETGYVDICYGIANDITELKLKSTLLDHVAEQIKINIGTYNHSTRELKCTHHTMHDFLYDETEQNMPECRIEKGRVHPDDYEIYRNLYASLSNDKNSSCEIRIKNLSNEFSWVKITLSPLQNNPSNFLYIATALDITEQKQLEARYNQILNSRSFQIKNTVLAKLIYNLTEDKIISLTNNLEISNPEKQPSASEFIAMQTKYIVPGYYREQYLEHFTVSSFLQKFRQGERQFQYVFPVERNNELFWISNNVTLFNNPDEKNIFASVNCYDISEEISRQVFSENYFNSQLDFLVQIDTVSDRYKFFPAAVGIEQYAEFRLTGKFSEDFANIMQKIMIDDEDGKIFKEIAGGTIITKLKQNERYSVTVKTYRKNRNPQCCYKQLRFYQYTFVPHFICLACTDVTEHYAKEQQKNEMLEQALKIATAANQTKNAFLASMSHDLRTPMNAIVSMTKLALEEKQNPPQTAEYLSIISESSNHLLSLVNDILEMNKLENSEPELHKEEFSLIEELTKLKDLFKISFQNKNQSFSCDLGKIIHSRVEGDKTKFNRIIANLLSNAHKYTPSAGKISLTAAEQHLQHKNMSVYTFAVSDTGIGIASENLHSVFDPFRREEDGTVQKTEGAGLGLSIVKMLAEKQGGSINVVSQKNKGSTFTVSLPYTTVKNAAQAADKAENSVRFKELPNLSVLAAEDNVINILVLKKLLEKLKAKITVAHNGQEALDMFSHNQNFDVILMDIQMPVMNGIEAAKRIRRLPSPKAREIPIIAVTANAFAGDVKKCLEAGMNAHISKPIKFEELYQFLEQYAPKN